MRKNGSRYFVQVLGAKKNVVSLVVGEFEHVYKAENENPQYEKDLRQRLDKLNRIRQKYVDMYAGDLLPREAPNAKSGGSRQEAERLENDLKLPRLTISKGEQLEPII